MFAARGMIEMDPSKLSEDELTEKALVDGVIDVRFGGDGNPPKSSPRSSR